MAVVVETLNKIDSSVEIVENLKIQALRGLNALHCANTLCNAPDMETIQKGLNALARLSEEDRNNMLEKVSLNETK